MSKEAELGRDSIEDETQRCGFEKIIECKLPMSLENFLRIYFFNQPKKHQKNKLFTFKKCFEDQGLSEVKVSEWKTHEINDIKELKKKLPKKEYSKEINIDDVEILSDKEECKMDRKDNKKIIPLKGGKNIDKNEEKLYKRRYTELVSDHKNVCWTQTVLMKTHPGDMYKKLLPKFDFNVMRYHVLRCKNEMKWIMYVKVKSLGLFKNNTICIHEKWVINRIKNNKIILKIYQWHDITGFIGKLIPNNIKTNIMESNKIGLTYWADYVRYKCRK